MIAELTMTTGPNGGFIPLTNEPQQQQQQQSPLLQRHQNDVVDTEMQRQQPDTQQQPMQQQQQRDVPGTPETLHPAERWVVPMPPPQVAVDRPAAGVGAGTHPVLRDEMTYA